MPDVNLPLPFDAYAGEEPFVFVSYAHKDGHLVYPEIKALHDSGVRIWFDGGIDPGNEWPEDIAQALLKAKMFLVFVTPSAVESKNVRDEINFAINNDKSFLAVHLQETQLPAGLALRMGGIQAILKHRMTKENYNKKLLSTFPKVFFGEKKKTEIEIVLIPAGTRIEAPSKPEIAGTRIERKVVKEPVVEETKEESEEDLRLKRRREKKGNNITVLTGVIIIGGAALLGIILIISTQETEVSSTFTPSATGIIDVKSGKMARISVAEDIAAEVIAFLEKEMVLIPAGKFMMGSPASEKDRDDHETQHEVTLTKPFYMGKYEVTQEQWESVMGNNPSSRTKGAKLPVTDVSWHECQEFIKKLNDKMKGGYRLPTEAEFEYSCRAGTSTAYSFGDSLSKSDANFTGKSIKEVGSYNSNAFGLYDIHGNVAEWCEDWYGDYPVGAVTDPKGPATGESRVLRGGSFYSNESKARSSGRYRFTPTTRYDSIGFRLARTK